MTAFSSERPDPIATDPFDEAELNGADGPSGLAGRTGHTSRPPPPVNSTWKIVRRCAG